MTLLFFNLASRSQIITGDWEGKFCYGSFLNSGQTYPISLNFELLSNGAYYVTSYTEIGKLLNGSPDIDVCEVAYRIVQPDSIYLQEVALLRSSTPSNTGFQVMSLKISTRKKRTELSGIWSIADGKGFGSGMIYFRKKKKE